MAQHYDPSLDPQRIAHLDNLADWLRDAGLDPRHDVVGGVPLLVIEATQATIVISSASTDDLWPTYSVGLYPDSSWLTPGEGHRSGQHNWLTVEKTVVAVRSAHAHAETGPVTAQVCLTWSLHEHDHDL